MTNAAESGNSERAVLAGGCFWGVQQLIRRQPGVISTHVGYTGGDVANATYRNHGTHAEAVEIVFDPTKTSYRKILEFFFQIHDPTTRNRQGNDIGMRYRSAIFYTTPQQERGARGTTVVMVSHDLGPMDALIDRSVVMRRGRIVYDGPPHASQTHAHVHHSHTTDDEPGWLPS